MSKKLLWNLAAILGAVAIVVVFSLLREEPPAMPRDETHRPVMELLAGGTGLEAVQAECATCHNPQEVPLPAEHPAGDKCLGCHRLQQ